MDWKRTRSVLADLKKLLTCAICKSYLSDPCTLDNCDHNFCRKCIEESLDNDSKCPECGLFSWLKDSRSNHQLATTVNMTLKLQSLISLNMEVDAFAPQGNSESSENTITFGSDEEMPDNGSNKEKTPSSTESVRTTKPDTSIMQSRSVADHIQSVNMTKPRTNIIESSSFADHTSAAETTTESINTEKHTKTRKSGVHAVKRHNKLTNQAGVTVPTSTNTKSTNLANPCSTEPEETTIEKKNVKQNTNDRILTTPNKIIKQPRITEQISATESMRNESISISEATDITENTNTQLAAAVKRGNCRTRNASVQQSSTKVKQSQRTQPHTTSESETDKISQSTTSVDTTESSSTTKAAKTTTVENTSDRRPLTQARRSSKRSDQNRNITQSENQSSDKTAMRRSDRKASETNDSRKKYFFRDKSSQQNSNLAAEPFDFTQQHDPFHFIDDDDNDDGSNDTDGNNGTDHCNKPSLGSLSNSTNNTLHVPQIRKTRRGKSNPFEFVQDVENDDGALQSTSSTSMRLRNNTRSMVTAEQTNKKTQFTHLKDRPTNSNQDDKSEVGKENKKPSSNDSTNPDKSSSHGAASEYKEMVENVSKLNIKRRRVQPKRNNIRQYLIAVDSVDTSDNSSDDVPSPEKRKKSQNLSTSSSQRTRNAAASSQRQSLRNKRGETPLHLAAIKGDFAFARELINDGADPNTKDHAGWTPLHEACNHGHVDIVQLFLDHGALINIPGFDNDTPLHDAVANNRLKVVKLLVTSGAALTARNKQGFLPMDYAVTKTMKAALSPPDASSGKTPAENMENVKKFADSHPVSKVVLGTALNTQDKVTLNKCTKLLGGKLVDEFDESVTHVVISVNENGRYPRTIKYLCGILTGKWIVSFEWIKDCLRRRQWINEDVYEVEGNVGNSCNAARKARFNMLQQMPRLLDGCSFFLRGVFEPPTPSKQDLTKLIKLGGGKMLHREPKVKDDDMTSLPSSPIVMSLTHAPEVAYHAPANSTLSCCTEFIIHDSTSCNQPKIVHSPVLRTAPATWLLDCISSFQLLDIPDV